MDTRVIASTRTETAVYVTKNLMKNNINPKQYWGSLELLYKNRFNSLMALAGRYVYNRDHAVDCVHSAFARAQEYFNNPRNKNRKVREQILVWLVLKEVKKKNRKESREIPYGDTRLFSEDSGNKDED